MADLATRIDSKVDRSGAHHLWTGAKKADGVGVIKIAGRLVTVRRAVWELTHGALDESARVLGCDAEPSCVRLDHLSVAGSPAPTSSTPLKKARSVRGTGSKRQIRPGVWKLEVTAGVHDNGTPRREFKTSKRPTPTKLPQSLPASSSKSAAPPLRRSAKSDR